jgi:hypothetical protein
MTLEPFQNEQVHDPEIECLVESLCARPSMYATTVTYGAVCAYLCGFDAARSGGPLVGLHQWLVVRHRTARRGAGHPVAWQAACRVLRVPPSQWYHEGVSRVRSVAAEAILVHGAVTLCQRPKRQIKLWGQLSCNV